MNEINEEVANAFTELARHAFCKERDGIHNSCSHEMLVYYMELLVKLKRFEITYRNGLIVKGVFINGY